MSTVLDLIYLIELTVKFPKHGNHTLKYVLFKKDFTGDAEAEHKSLVSSFSSYL